MVLLIIQGVWDGVIGDVITRRANFSLVLSLTMERRKYVDFTRMYYTDPLVFVTSRNNTKSQWYKLIKPFKGTFFSLRIL